METVDSFNVVPAKSAEIFVWDPFTAKEYVSTRTEENLRARSITESASADVWRSHPTNGTKGSSNEVGCTDAVACGGETALDTTANGFEDIRGVLDV